jgi:hypothetical protein
MRRTAAILGELGLPMFFLQPKWQCYAKWQPHVTGLAGFLKFKTQLKKQTGRGMPRPAALHL